MQRTVTNGLKLYLALFVCFVAEGCGFPFEWGDTTGGTGTLRVLVTDKPYPFDQIEQALITITRVEVRRAVGEECDNSCDDGLFCNGEETCDAETGGCLAGTPPACDPGQVCDESADACVPACKDRTDCDDTLFCNGVETCDVATGLCQEGDPACGQGSFCDETAGTCSDACTVDLQCNDGLFCNGEETCNIDTGNCETGTPPTCGEDEVCHSRADQCINENDVYGSPFIVISDVERDFDLLDLRDGKTDLLAEATVPAGTYTQVRLIVTAGKVTLKGDEEETPPPILLEVPSGAQTGIKLHFTFEVEEGGVTTLLLDVDMSRAFKPIPGGHLEDPTTIRKFHFSPSIAMRLIDLRDAGSIAGTVTKVGDVGEFVTLGDVSVTARDSDGEEVTSTSTDEIDGTYVLGGLATGEYSVEFSAAGYDDFGPVAVSVVAGQTTENLDVTMTLDRP